MKRFFLMFVGLLLSSFLGLQAQEWHTDFEEAKKLASEEHKPIVLVFQGSDWCAPCIRLDREIWSASAFQEYAKDHFIMVKADFPRKKQNALPEELEAQNKELAERYNQQGYFPLVVVLDEKGEVLGETGYKKVSPEAYVQLLASISN